MPNHQPSSKLIRRLSLSFQALLRAIYNFLRKVIFLFLRSRLQSKVKSKHKKNLLQNTPRLAKAGFVLPTTVLVLLVVSLFAGALISRTGDRAEDVIRSRESERIDSVAAPAVERAKAKLEYIFNRDPRFPAGVPSESLVRDMMLYIDTSDLDLISDGSGGNEPDPYTLPNETRIDLDGDGNDDNAWRYETDLDGDGTTEVVAYSILMNSGVDGNGDGDIESGDTADVGYWSSDSDKAANLITRTGPVSIQAAEGVSSDCQIPTLEDEQGWFAADATSVRKNFQVNVFVENKNQANKTVTALEFQQDRQLDKGNKFGVWFRYDLIIHPGPAFRLNGAIHTDGNLFTWNDSLRFFLVSSPDSCIYSEDASIIELTQEEEDNVITFQGQAVSTGNDTEEVDLYGPNGPSPAKVAFSPTTDSVKGKPNSSTGIYQYSLDPLVLYTEDRLVSRGAQNNDGSYDTSVRDPNWNTSNLSTRIRNDVSLKPYVDDLYRADDRWGPKPKYGKEENVTIAKLTNGFDENGDLIEASDSTDLNIDTLLGLNPPDEFPQEVGLDGYWERRAYTQGLRVIVGQRLELGNAFGWTNDDPLYPINTAPTGSRANEKRQLKTLRDNLAAVQATAIYHYNDDGDEGVGDFPIATIATTAHPGTTQTVEDSTKFDRATGIDLDGDSNDDVLTNFLEGQGTNGWEFYPPGSTFDLLETPPPLVKEITTDTAFADLINSKTDDPLRRALENLAYFAGDPDGAFPPKQDDNTSGSSGVMHPYPYLTMWGDYSNLRRVIAQLDSGTAYTDLSLADKTTLQTASATLGMLAYNLDVVQEEYEAAQGAVDTVLGTLSNGQWTSVGTQLANMIGANNINPGKPIIGKDGKVCTSTGTGIDGDGCPSQNPNDVTDSTDPEFYGTYFSQFSLDDWIFFVENGGVNAAAKNAVGPVLQAYKDNLTDNPTVLKALRIQRDRERGFERGIPGASTPYFDSSTGIYTIPPSGQPGSVNSGEIGPGNTYQLGCDPNSDTYGLNFVNSDKAKLGLATIVCNALSPDQEPHYPSLYYLFPVAEHAHDGTLSSAATTAGAIEVIQPTAEDYVSDTYIFDNTNSSGVNWKDDGAGNNDLFFVVVDDTDSSGVEDGSEDSFSAIALPPKDRSNWTLPNSTTKPTKSSSSAANLTDAAINEIDDDGTDVYIPFLDKGMYNGRQQMAVRVLNIDFGFLKDNTISSGESWLPNSGLFYAFREDAMREDGIARPNAETWANCDTETDLTDTSNNCYMDPAIPRDPPKQADNAVSPKPVDYIADPDRRPHGFRLSNGSALGRSGTTRGLSFISDNPTYFLGDFNLHSQEEFTEALQDNYNNFYSRSTLNSDFAKSAGDDWRPSEVLADAITFLSNSFCDGVIENAIKGEDGDCSGRPSYRNTKLQDSGGGNSSGSKWDREDPEDDPVNPVSPIAVNRNGQLLYDDGDKHDSLKNTNNVQKLNKATETTVNAVIVQGLSPTRENESYGGLHNFPRFNENWGGTDLNIRGSFVQLNFSTYDTANLDQQDTFRPASSAQGGNHFPFYRPPRRKWGYDVGLQYNPPGPIVERLLSQSGLRSEIYQEIEASDPYIQQLCKAATSNSQTCQ